MGRRCSWSWGPSLRSSLRSCWRPFSHISSGSDLVMNHVVQGRGQREAWFIKGHTLLETLTDQHEIAFFDQELFVIDILNRFLVIQYVQ
jgi:hypothetical protein